MSGDSWETDRPVRWGILGAARIARSGFLPALKAAGDGVLEAVASREKARADEWVAEMQAGRAVHGYEELLADKRVDAVYVGLPNALHAEWTIRALEAGKAVLCEKPLAPTPADVHRVLEVARRLPGPLWEAFVFPFQAQTSRLKELLAQRAIGELREIWASFHYALRTDQDIRWSLPLAGGSLLDLGCYPIRFARLLFEDEPTEGWAHARIAPTGVDRETIGALKFPGERTLLMSCGFDRVSSAYTRLVGTRGEILVDHPYHPGAKDGIEIWTAEGNRRETLSADEPSFTRALRHIHAAIRHDEPPRHLAVDEAEGNALAIAQLAQKAGLSFAF